MTIQTTLGLELGVIFNITVKSLVACSESLLLLDVGTNRTGCRFWDNCTQFRIFSRPVTLQLSLTAIRHTCGQFNSHHNFISSWGLHGGFRGPMQQRSGKRVAGGTVAVERRSRGHSSPVVWLDASVPRCFLKRNSRQDAT